MTMPPPIKTTELTLTRTISARPDAVFDVWMDPKSPGGPWFGASRLIFDGRVDGLFHHAMQHAGREWAHYGRFVAVDRPARVVFTWMSEATRGLDSVVTVTFEPRDERTLLTLHHANVPDDELGRQHADGWGFMLDMIAKRLAPKP